MTHRLPLLAWLLGLGGLIPFFALGAGAVARQADWAALSLQGLLGYGACILSFLGAVHWGFALGGSGLASPGDAQSARVLRARLGLGVLPALIGWVALLVGAVGLPGAALGVLVAGFAVTIVAEAQASRQGLLPPGYIWLRWVLTTVVITLLILVAVAHLMGLTISL